MRAELLQGNLGCKSNMVIFFNEDDCSISQQIFIHSWQKLARMFIIGFLIWWNRPEVPQGNLGSESNKNIFFSYHIQCQDRIDESELSLTTPGFTEAVYTIFTSKTGENLLG